MTGRKTGAGVLHTFFQLDDGSCLAFFEAPDMPFEFKEQHDFDLHIALEVEPDALDAMFAKGKAGGPRDARHLGPQVHPLDLLPRSERLRDRAHRQGARPRTAMDPKKSRAREILNDWQAARSSRQWRSPCGSHELFPPPGRNEGPNAVA